MDEEPTAVDPQQEELEEQANDLFDDEDKAEEGSYERLHPCGCIEKDGEYVTLCADHEDEDEEDEGPGQDSQAERDAHAQRVVESLIGNPEGWLDHASFSAFRVACKPAPKQNGVEPTPVPIEYVRITAKETQATDGTAMVRVRHRAAAGGKKAREIPVPLFIRRGDAESLCRDAKRHEIVEVHENARPDGVWLEFLALDRVEKDGLPIYYEAEIRQLPAEETIGKYPPIEELGAPQGREPLATVTLSAIHLVQIAAIAKAIRGPQASLTLEVWGERDPVQITVMGSDRMTAAIMPRVEGED